MVSGLQKSGFIAFWIFLDCLLCHRAYLLVVPVLSVLCYFLKHEPVLNSFSKSGQKLLASAHKR